MMLDARLDVENEKSRLEKCPVKCELNKRSRYIPCEIATYRPIFHLGSVLLDQDFTYVMTFEFRQPVNIDGAFFN